MNSRTIYWLGLGIHEIEPDHSEVSQTSVVWELKPTLLTSGWNSHVVWKGEGWNSSVLVAGELRMRFVADGKALLLC